MFFDDQGRLRSLLACWTDIDEPDEFTRCAAGRAWLRVDDLQHLRALLDEIVKGQGIPTSVNQITPHV